MAEKGREAYSQKNASPEVFIDDVEMHLNLNGALVGILAKVFGHSMLSNGERANDDGMTEHG